MKHFAFENRLGSQCCWEWVAGTWNSPQVLLGRKACGHHFSYRHPTTNSYPAGYTA